MLKFKNLVAFCLALSMLASVSADLLVSATNISSDSETYQNIELNDISSDESLRTLELIRSLIASGDETQALDLVISYYESLGVTPDYNAINLSREIISIKNENENITEPELTRKLEASIITPYFSTGMTDADKKLALAYPVEAVQVAACRKWANNTTTEYYGYNGSGDHTDAFRHAYWNALMSHDIGDTMAKRFADAHETHPSSYYSKIFTCGYSGRRHTDMDLHNNQMGRYVMTSPSMSYEQLRDGVLNKIRAGHHSYLHAHFNCE